MNLTPQQIEQLPEEHKRQVWQLQQQLVRPLLSLLPPPSAAVPVLRARVSSLCTVKSFCHYALSASTYNLLGNSQCVGSVVILTTRNDS